MNRKTNLLIRLHSESRFSNYLSETAGFKKLVTPCSDPIPEHGECLPNFFFAHYSKNELICVRSRCRLRTMRTIAAPSARKRT